MKIEFNQAHVEEVLKKIMGRETLPVYNSFEHTRPAKKINLSELVRMVQDPRIGPKEKTTPALTPFDGDGKTKDIAQSSLYCGLPVDHDHDNIDADGIRARYGRYDMAYIAWTTSSHQQGGKGNRWKVLIPFSEPVGFALWVEIAKGAALMTGADLAQARSQQVFFAPNKLAPDAPYESIIHLDRPFIDPAESHPFIKDCLFVYTKDQEAKQSKAEAATPKPRTLNGYDGDIIQKINQAYRMDEVLQGAGYILKGKKYLSPNSESGDPGVTVLNRDGKETVYSHHGATDPLSNLNHNGHALDVLDTLRILQYGGDLSRAIRELAPQVDPEGQRERQREYAEQKPTAAADLEKSKKMELPELIEPLPLERIIEGSDPYPLDALGEIIGNAARIMNKVIQAPDGLCAHAVLGFATHSIQGIANVNIDGRIIPLNEFFLSIGSRSARKTECDSKAGQFHKNFQKQLLSEYQTIRSAYLDEKEVYSEEKKKILNDKKKTLSEKNTAFEELRKHEPKGPYEPLIIFSDPTIEGIHRLFLMGTPSKYLCADEGGQVSGGHSMTAEKKTYTATTYSKYWDGAPIDRVRGGDGASVLYGRRLSMHLMMQDKIAAEFFNDEIMRNQGLLSRFLCSYPESLAGQRHYQAKDVSNTPEMERYYQQIQRNLKEPLPLRVDEKTGDLLNELEPRTITLEDTAKQAWIIAYEAIEVESGKGREFESIEGFAGKAGNHIIRLAGIMALFDDITRKTISKPYIDNAITLMEYYLNERLRLTKMAEPNLELEQAKTLLKWIKEKGLKGVTLPDVYQLGPSRIRNKNQAQTSVKILENHHWLIKKDDGGISQLTGKKSNEAYEVNDGEI